MNACSLRSSVISVFLLTTLLAAGQKKNIIQPPYFPPYGQWEIRSPEQVGLDPEKIQSAILLAIAAESRNPRSMEENHYRTFGREPFGEAIGPMNNRGAQTGVIIRNGFVVAAWGDPDRPDMTHSVTKSFLSAVTGLAVDKGLIKSVHDTVRAYVPPILPYRPEPTENKADRFGSSSMLEPFSSNHNRTITWDHLLRQTSDWEGTLWGKPDWADRPSENTAEWLTRPRNKPGAVFEYNDVRVNALALASLMVWRKPLPQVLKENLMDPIGASTTWRWYGYENSWVVLDGLAVQSVSGGGHWGGGMIINGWDMARFGYLMLRNGRWRDRQLISEDWIRMSSTPTPVKTDYGFMNWYLNTDKKFLPSAPSTAVTHVGNGTNIIYVDRVNDLVVVCRWVETKELDAIIGTIVSAIRR
ncbi:MAG: serine hydrolase domain-containing protein [Bacteroidota bacterium]